MLWYGGCHIALNIFASEQLVDSKIICSLDIIHYKLKFRDYSVYSVSKLKI